MGNVFEGKKIINHNAPKTWYLKGVNINYSFKTLENLSKDLGATLEDGDTLIVDNFNGDKRKAFKKTRNGSVIVYASLHRTKFNEMAVNKNKSVKTDTRPLIDFFKA